MPAADRSRLPWQGTLRRHIAIWFLVKLVALALLWALFFSPAQRPRVDALTILDRLAAAPSYPAHD
jgi:hypothetical protein